MSENKMATKADLQRMYNKILPYLGGTAEAGFTPVGTIIAVMGNSAPANYLACNGQVVNIADYPVLADYFEVQFGTKNHFGGDGTTTFGVPDLRGEFLRGTGTNSHANQGSGESVGTHQDSTQFPTNMFGTSGGNANKIEMRGIGDGGGNVSIKNADANIPSTSLSNVKKFLSQDGTITDITSGTAYTTIRPTNTSVLYCIATHNIFINPELQYSTQEQVVGTWIDGKPLYQKTFLLPSGNASPGSDYLHYLSISDIKLHNFNTEIYRDTGSVVLNNDANKDYFFAETSQESNGRISILYRRYAGNAGINGGYCTIQYTKTTD